MDGGAGDKSVSHGASMSMAMKSRIGIFKGMSRTEKYVYIDTMSGWQAAAKTRTQISELAAKKGWPFTDRELDKLAQLAERVAFYKIRKRSSDMLTEVLRRLELLYKKALERKNLRVALEVMKEVAKIGDLYPDKRLKVDGQVNVKHDVDVSVFAQIEQYTEEFKIAARAEKIESRMSMVLPTDLEEAGGPRTTSKQQNQDAAMRAVPGANIIEHIEENLTDEPMLEDIEE
jgi:hypothetical protein